MHCVSHRCTLDLIIEGISWQPLGATSFSLLYWVVLVLYRTPPVVLVWLFGHLDVKCIRQLLWTQSVTSCSLSSKSKVPQVNPTIRPAHDPKKQGACAKSSGDLVPCDQTRNKSHDSSHVLPCDKSWDQICFGWARSPLINKWQTMGTVCNQRRYVTPVIGQYW